MEYFRKKGIRAEQRMNDSEPESLDALRKELDDLEAYDRSLNERLDILAEKKIHGKITHGRHDRESEAITIQISLENTERRKAILKRIDKILADLTRSALNS